MSSPTARAALLVALALAAASPARAQTSAERERLRVEKERADRAARVEREREERDREARDRAERRRFDVELEARERERDRERERARERALERARETRERTLQLERDRLTREREARDRAYQAERVRRLAEERRAAELRRALEIERAARAREARARDLRRRRWSDDYRPRVSLSGGVDMRQFDGADDRFLVLGGVDFRSRSGLGMRPEVLFAWTDPGPGAQLVTSPGGTPVGTVSASGRNRALGLMLNATYTFFRGSTVRPYVIGGPGIVSTRFAPVTATMVGTPPGAEAIGVDVRHDLDVGLNAGGGLELSLGPVRLFAETRYFLTDSPPSRGFSGMVPITAGIRF